MGHARCHSVSPRGQQLGRTGLEPILSTPKVEILTPKPPPNPPQQPPPRLWGGFLKPWGVPSAFGGFLNPWWVALRGFLSALLGVLLALGGGSPALLGFLSPFGVFVSPWGGSSALLGFLLALLGFLNPWGVPVSPFGVPQPLGGFPSPFGVSVSPFEGGFPSPFGVPVSPFWGSYLQHDDADLFDALDDGLWDPGDGDGSLGGVGQHVPRHLHLRPRALRG